jgi:hypothetical protein
VLSAAPDWRWLTEREDSPWYPTMRLFRQREPNDWEDVFNRVAAELKALTGEAKSTASVGRFNATYSRSAVGVDPPSS